MDFWIIAFIFVVVATIVFYLGFRVGYVKAESFYTLDDYSEEENLP